MSEIKRIFDAARREGRKVLFEHEAKYVCMKYGVPCTRFKLATTIDQAAKYSEEIGYPIALKIVSPDVIHKTDSGGVILNLKNRNEIRSSYNKIMANVMKKKKGAKIIGVLVQKMAPSSTEIVIGSIKDPQFGQTLMFGLGGIFVEVFKDVAFRIVPIKREDARKMISEVKGYPLLMGYRNQPSLDIDIIVKILISISKLVTDYPEIKEMDLNPVIVYENGAKMVDARIILE